MFQHTAARRRLLACRQGCLGTSCSFNTQPPEGGCVDSGKGFFMTVVSTHSRPKAAAGERYNTGRPKNVSTHSRPKAAATLQPRPSFFAGCFNTQPPEGGCKSSHSSASRCGVSTHSRPKAAAQVVHADEAAEIVSTHSRPKAAARVAGFIPSGYSGFNTQPPEGGCPRR